MSNVIYTNFRNAALGGGSLGPIDMDSDTIKVILGDSADYTFSAAHTNLSQLASAARVSTATLSGKTVGTVGTGVFDSDDPTFTSVTGDQSEFIVLYKDTGTEATSPLIAYYDTFTSGMPITPNGGNCVLTVSSAGWFSF